MRIFIAALILSYHSISGSGTQDFVKCEVILARPDVVYFNAGRLLGVAPGETFEIYYDGVAVAAGKIAWADKYVSRSEELDPADVAGMNYSDRLTARINLFAAEANKGGWLTVPFLSELNLEPASIKTPDEKMIGRLIHRGLLSRDANGQIIPDLAGNFEERGLTYTFYINPEAKFHSGKPVEASDVAYSFERLALSPRLTTAGNYVLMIKGAEEFRHRMKNEMSGLFLIDKNTISVTLKEPFPAFEDYLAGPGGYIVPRPGLEAPGNNVIGAGIYKIKWRNPDGLTLEPFADDLTSAHLDSIHFVRFKSIDDAGLSFELGRLDLITTLGEPPPKFISGGRETSMITSTICSAVLGINGLRDFQRDLSFSKALTYLLDRETIIRVILGGSGRMPEDLTVGYGYDQVNVNPDSADYYFAKIEKLPQAVSLYVDSNYPSLISVARYIAGQLQSRGIKVKEKKADLSSLEDDRTRSDIDLYLNYHNPVSPDPDCELYPLYSYLLSGQTNYLFSRDGALQESLSLLRRETDPERREILAAGLRYSLIKEPPAIILFEPYLTTIFKNDVSGVRPLEEGYLDLRGAFIEADK